MRSTRPKPLHLLCGRAMLLYVLDALAECDTRRAVIVVGHGAERVTKKLQEEAPDLVLDFVEQHVQRGTGDAASVGLTVFPDDDLDEEDGDVLVLPGDTPLLRPETVAALVATHRDAEAACTVLTARLDDPSGYGRVVRGKDGRVQRVVEQVDATDEELEIDEINTSIYCFRRSLLAPALRRLSPENAQGEYYLTDVVEVLHDGGLPGGGHGGRRRTRDPGRQRPGAAGRGRGRAPAPHQRAMAAPRGHHARPRAHLHRPTVLLAPDVTLFPGHAAAGSVRGRRRSRDRSRHPPGRLRGGCPVRWSSTAWAVMPRSATMPSSVRSPCSSRAAWCRPPPAPARSTLRPPRRSRPSDGPRARGSGIRMEVVTKKRLHLVSGRANLPLAEEIAERLGVALGDAEPGRVRQRRAALPLRRVGARHRRLHHPEPQQLGCHVGQRRADGAADHGRCGQAGLGQAHHRRLPLLRLRPPGPQGRGSRAHHAPSSWPTCSVPPGPSAS